MALWLLLLPALLLLLLVPAPLGPLGGWAAEERSATGSAIGCSHGKTSAQRRLTPTTARL